MRTLKQLFRLHKFLFWTATAFTFAAAHTNLCWNGFLAVFLDKFSSVQQSFIGRTDTHEGMMAAAGLGLIALYAVNEYGSSYLASYTCEMFVHEMRMGYARHYLYSDIRMLAGLNAGEEESAMQNELQEVSVYFNENLFAIMKQFVSFVCAVIFLFCQNVKLAFLSIIPVIPLIVYCFCSSKIIKTYSGQCYESKKSVNGMVTVMLELFPVILIYDAYRLMERAIDERLAEWENGSVRRERVTAKLMSFSGMLFFLPLLCLIGFGGYMVINHEISIGIFYIFLNLLGNVSGFLQNMPGIYAGFRRFCASVDRLDEVSFAYKKNKVLEGLSLKVREGEHIGIVGDSGCGKSTLLKILAGLYQADSGSVIVAGETEPEKIRRQVAFVMQTENLFPLSVRDNITCGHDIAEGELWKICEHVSLTKWIKSLPGGLDTSVGERGSQVSGGQSQRIQIACTLCKNVPVILLDEPVSALDHETRYDVLCALDRLTAGKTVIHVTHYPETLDDGYKICRMEGGKFVCE